MWYEETQVNHLIEAEEHLLRSSNWYAALIVALSLPDIAGWIDDPMQSSRSRYSDWFERFVCPYYTGWIDGAEHVILSGDDCFALRCSLLQEERDIILPQGACDALARFQFIAPQQHDQLVHCTQVDNKVRLQVDVFCRDICKGIAVWLASIPRSDTDRRGRLAGLAIIDLGHNGI